METFLREIVAEAEFGWLCYLEKKLTDGIVLSISKVLIFIVQGI